MAKLKVAQDLIDFFYPVGSYYETSNSDFNPNTEWGGTWVEDSNGLVTVAVDASTSLFKYVGKTGGETAHTLTINEIPKHNHYNQSGTNLNYQGYYVMVGYLGGCASGSITQTSYVGKSYAHNNVQPYVVVKRWHRTA